MSATRVPDTLADVLRALGDIPPDRVLWTPRPGTATGADLLRTRGTELVDGVLAWKSAGMLKGFLEVVIGGPLFTFIHPHRLGCATIASRPVGEPVASAAWMSLAPPPLAGEVGEGNA